MPLGLGIMQLGLELINLIMPSYQIKILTCTWLCPQNSS